MADQQVRRTCAPTLATACGDFRRLLEKMAEGITGAVVRFRSRRRRSRIKLAASVLLGGRNLISI